MALGAMAANPECKVKIVPVGVSISFILGTHVLLKLTHVKF